LLQTIVGKRGRGKTSLAAEILVSQKRDQVFIYDYCGEFSSFAVENYIYVENTTTGFVPFMVNLWSRCRPGINSLLILDEIAVYGKNNLQIDHAYRLGRHAGLDIIAISQRFYSLPPIVRSQSDIFHVFQITEKRDIDYLKGLVSEPVLRTIMNLTPFSYINISL
jgi:hypothetical protein